MVLGNFHFDAREVGAGLLVERALVRKVKVGDVPGLVLAACDVGRQRRRVYHGAAQLERLLGSLEPVEGALHRRRKVDDRRRRGELRLLEGPRRHALLERNLEDRDEFLHQAGGCADEGAFHGGEPHVGREDWVLQQTRLDEVGLRDPELLVHSLQGTIVEQRDLDGRVDGQLLREQLLYPLRRSGVLEHGRTAVRVRGTRGSQEMVVRRGASTGVAVRRYPRGLRRRSDAMGTNGMDGGSPASDAVISVDGCERAAQGESSLRVVGSVDSRSASRRRATFR